MDNLKKYMEENGAGLKDEKPLFGDEERFFAKLDASRTVLDRLRGISFQSSLKRRKIPMWRIVAVPIAAVALVFLALNIFMKSVGSEKDQLNRIYLEYCAEVNNLSTEINSISVSESERDMNERTIEAISFEAIPFAAQLPAEMSEKDKIKAMKEYYSQKLDGIRRLKVLVSESMIDVE